MANAAPLAPGKPAGVHKAEFEGGNGMLIVAGARLGIGITRRLQQRQWHIAPTAPVRVGVNFDVHDGNIALREIPAVIPVEPRGRAQPGRRRQR